MPERATAALGGCGLRSDHGIGEEASGALVVIVAAGHRDDTPVPSAGT
jgi:hypothetical protein